MRSKKRKSLKLTRDMQINKKNTSTLKLAAPINLGRVLILTIVALLFFLPQPIKRAHASDNSTQAAVKKPASELNKKSSSNVSELFFNHFISAAIDKHTITTTAFPPENWLLDADDATKQQFQKDYPWFADFAYRESGEPRYAVINKWVTPIKVSTGFPNNLEPFSPGPQTIFINAWPQSDDTYNHILEEEIAALKPMLDIGDLTINYLRHSEENLETFGNVRVIFSHGMPRQNSSTKGVYSQIIEENGVSHDKVKNSFRHNVEAYLSHLVYFTANQDHQVDGYLLSNHKNEIQLAICYIYVGNDDIIVRGLVRECLVRALGFPGVSSYDPGYSIFEAWNHVLKSSPRVQERDIWNPPQLTDLDRKAISLLYDTRIQPGMTAREVYKILQK